MDKSAISRAVTVAGGRFAPGHLGELGLRVEQVEMRWRTRLEQVDDPLRFRREVQRLQRARGLRHRVGRAQQARIQERGQRIATARFVLILSARAEAGPARLGITASRKVGNAVVRNRVRRRLKEALRAAAPLEAEGDHDYVLMARRDTLGRRFTALVDDVRTAFRAARRGEADGRGRGPAKRTTKNRDARA